VRDPDGDIVLEPENITVTLDSVEANDDGGASDGPENQRDDVRLVESVTTGDGDDTIIGDASDETLITGTGEDKLFGNAGNDTLTGGPDKDRFDGGVDEDTLETKDRGLDEPISCGEGPDEDPGGDFLTKDKITGDVADLLANPAIVLPGDPTECEIHTFE
jgi:Ca2+-binding RTX toxin-like protein